MDANDDKRTVNYRLFWIWRFMAALLVMIYHFSHYLPEPGPVLAWWERMNPLLDMFFVLSGFLIFDRYRDRIGNGGDYLRFLVRRLCRLYPLHLATLAFFVLVGLAVNFGHLPSGGGAARYDFSALVPNLLLVQAWGGEDALTFNYVSWSLSAEWFAYVAFPVVIAAFARAGIGGLVSLLLVTLFLLEVADAGYTNARQLWYDAKLWGAYRVFADFVYGAILCVLVQGSSWRLTSQVPAWLLMATAVAGMHLGFGFYASLSLIGLAILFGAVAERNRPGVTAWMNPFLPVAAVAFGVYLWHPVVEAVMYSALWRYVIGPSQAVPFALYTALAMAVSVAVAMISARYFEVPVSRWATARFEKWESRRRSRTAATFGSGI